MVSSFLSVQNLMLRFISLLVFYPVLAQAALQLLTRDGPVTNLVGYLGTAYQAIRYEPLCGNLGTDSRFSKPISMGGLCTAVMEVYSNNTIDNIALYDLTGIRLRNAIIGGGTELCMCFSLSQQVASGIKGDICLYVDGTAQAAIWWSIALDSFAASEYRPGSYKSLPLCSNVDLNKIKADWSLTAAQPRVTERVTTLGNVGAGSNGGGRTTTLFSASTLFHTNTVVSISTIIPSVIDYTLTSIFTTTDSQGRLTTQTQTTETKIPVVTAPPQGMTQGDKIALGVGLGIGIPTVLLSVIGVTHGILRSRRRYL